jgi:hypothetical protein
VSISISEIVEKAKASVRAQKKVVPYIFDEWQELRRAEMNFAEAKKRLEAAKKRWKELGQ